MNIFSRWLESIGQNPDTFLKDAIIFVIRFCVVIFIIFLPVNLLTITLKPFAPAIHAALPKPLTPSVPQFWLIFVPFGIYVLWATMTGIALLGSWRRLADQFSAPQKFAEGQLFKQQSGSVGVINFNKILNIRVASQGLYLACSFPFNWMHPPIIIPWPRVTAVRQKRLFKRATSYLTIGSPKLATIALQNEKIIEAAKNNGFLNNAQVHDRRKVPDQ